MHWGLIWVLSIGTGSAYFSNADQCQAALTHMKASLADHSEEVIYILHLECEAIAEGGMPTRENRSQP